MAILYEIEVKARVRNFTELMNRLSRMGCVLSDPVVQRDTIFLPSGLGFEDITTGVSVLRVRRTERSTFLTLKQDRSNELDCVEVELEVNDASRSEDMLRLLGYLPVICVVKARRTGRIEDCHICLDEVENLGCFVEIEKHSENDGEQTQHELFGILERLGISSDDRVIHGYDRLLYLQNSGCL